jgi:hypothetical protein
MISEIILPPYSGMQAEKEAEQLVQNFCLGRSKYINKRAMVDESSQCLSRKVYEHDLEISDEVEKIANKLLSSAAAAKWFSDWRRQVL